jgi:predicted RNase H-like HicB family nuclease
MTRYAVVIERGDSGYGAWVPDLPGCVATGRTRAIVARRIREAIQFHIDGLRAEGLPIPEPRSGMVLVEAS